MNEPSRRLTATAIVDRFKEQEAELQALKDLAADLRAQLSRFRRWTIVSGLVGLASVWCVVLGGTLLTRSMLGQIREAKDLAARRVVPDYVEAKGFILKDEGDRIVGRWGPDDQWKTRLEMLHKGKDRIWLGVTENGAATTMLYDAGGNVRVASIAALDSAGIGIRSPGSAAINLSSFADGQLVFDMSDPETKSEIRARIMAGCEPEFDLLDHEGTVRQLNSVGGQPILPK